MSKKINMNLFLLNYKGNKYNETNKYLKDIDIKKYDIIAEPFCGIFGFSRCLFAYNPDYQGRFFLNDIDSELVAILNKLKDKTTREELLKDIDNFIEKHNDSVGDIVTKDLRASNNYLLKKVFVSVNDSLYCLDKGKTKIKNFRSNMVNYEKFFELCEFTNKPADEFIKGLPNKKILLFYDPPYFDSSNTGYDQFVNTDIYGKFKERKDNTSFYLDILHSFQNNKNYDHVMILNKIDLVNYLFRDYIDSEHEKIYQSTVFTKKNGNQKSKTTHIIYKSYNIK